MICRLRSAWETVTFPAFWASLMSGPLVVVSGHLWSEVRWSEPRLSTEGWIEDDLSVCVDCGYTEPAWRRFWGLVP